MPGFNNKEAISLGLSIAVVVLTILAIVFFVLYGGGALFYGTAFLAIIFGFAMAYFVSKTPERVTSTAPSTSENTAAQTKRKRQKRAS